MNLAVDTQLLVLLIVGQTATKYIRSHKRLGEFDLSDFDLLLQIIEQADRLIITPNVATETSNLVRFIAEPARTQIATTFRDFISAMSERNVASADAAARAEFLRLGLADAAMLEIGDQGVTLLTADAGLYTAALQAGQRAEWFDAYRATG